MLSDILSRRNCVIVFVICAWEKYYAINNLSQLRYYLKYRKDDIDYTDLFITSTNIELCIHCFYKYSINRFVSDAFYQKIIKINNFNIFDNMISTFSTSPLYKYPLSIKQIKYLICKSSFFYSISTLERCFIKYATIFIDYFFLYSNDAYLLYRYNKISLYDDNLKFAKKISKFNDFTLYCTKLDFTYYFMGFLTSKYFLIFNDISWSRKELAEVTDRKLRAYIAFCAPANAFFRKFFRSLKKIT